MRSIIAGLLPLLFTCILSSGPCKAREAVPRLVLQCGHEGRVMALAFLQGKLGAGPRLLSGDSGGLVNLWDPITGKILWSYRGGGQVRDLAVSPRGTMIGVATDKEVLCFEGTDSPRLLWSWQGGTTSAGFSRDPMVAAKLAFLPDNAIMAGAMVDGRVLFWNCKSGHLVDSFVTGTSQSLMFAKPIVAVGGNWLAASGRFGSFTLRPVTAEGWRHSLEGPSDVREVTVRPLPTSSQRREEHISSLTFTADARTIIVGITNAYSSTNGGYVLVYDCATGKLLRKLPSFQKVLHNVTLAPDEKTLLTVEGTLDNAELVRRWRLADGTPLGAQNLPPRRLMAYSPQGDMLAMADEGWDGSSPGQIDLRRTVRGVVTQPPLPTALPARSMQHPPLYWHGKNLVVLCCGNRRVVGWNLQNASLEWISSVPAHSKYASDHTFATIPDGKLVGAFTDGDVESPGTTTQITVWDVRSGAVMRTMKARFLVLATPFLHFLGGRLLRISSWTSGGATFDQMEVWDLGNLRSVRKLPTLMACGTVLGAQPTSDGKGLILADADNVIRTYGAATGRLKGITTVKLTRSIDTESLSVLSTGGRYWAAPTGTAQLNPALGPVRKLYGPNRVVVFDAATGKRNTVLPALRGVLACMEFAPDGKSLLTATRDGQLELWSVPGGRRISRFRVSGRVYALRFREDGNLLATVTDRGELTVFACKTGAMLAQCFILGPVDGLATQPEWLVRDAAGRYNASPGARKFYTLHTGAQVLDAAAADARWLRPHEVRQGLAAYFLRASTTTTPMAQRPTSPRVTNPTQNPLVNQP